MKIEQEEVRILSNYIPKQLNENETKKLCEEIVNKLQIKSIKDMGKIMGELKKSHSENLDFSIAGKVLRELLNK